MILNSITDMFVFLISIPSILVLWSHHPPFTPARTSCHFRLDPIVDARENRGRAPTNHCRHSKSRTQMGTKMSLRIPRCRRTCNNSERHRMACPPTAALKPPLPTPFLFPFPECTFFGGHATFIHLFIALSTTFHNQGASGCNYYVPSSSVPFFCIVTSWIFSRLHTITLCKGPKHVTIK